MAIKVEHFSATEEDKKFARETMEYLGHMPDDPKLHVEMMMVACTFAQARDGITKENARLRKALNVVLKVAGAGLGDIPA